VQQEVQAQANHLGEVEQCNLMVMEPPATMSEGGTTARAPRPTTTHEKNARHPRWVRVATEAQALNGKAAHTARRAEPNKSGTWQVFVDAMPTANGEPGDRLPPRCAGCVVTVREPVKEQTVQVEPTLETVKRLTARVSRPALGSAKPLELKLRRRLPQLTAHGKTWIPVSGINHGTS
jgi:hypothetical protein